MESSYSLLYIWHEWLAVEQIWTVGTDFDSREGNSESSTNIATIPVLGDERATVALVDRKTLTTLYKYRLPIDT